MFWGQLLADFVGILMIVGGGFVLIAVSWQHWRNRGRSTHEIQIRRWRRLLISASFVLIAIAFAAYETVARKQAQVVTINPEVIAEAARRGAKEATEEAIKATVQRQQTHATSAMANLAQPPRLSLYDRDPESWRGHRYGEGALKLEEQTRLEMPVGTWQRFNPQIQTAESLSGVNVFVIAPRFLEFQPTKLWRISSNDNQAVQYWGAFGDINPGVVQGIDEALHFKVAVPTKFNIAYVVSARGERSGGFSTKPTILTIEAK